MDDLLAIARCLDCIERLGGDPELARISRLYLAISLAVAKERWQKCKHLFVELFDDQEMTWIVD